MAHGMLINANNFSRLHPKHWPIDNQGRESIRV